MNNRDLGPDDRAVLEQTVSHIEDRVKILREAEPYLIDMSAREASLSSYIGHTLEDKIELYKMACDLGFHDIGLPNFFGFPSVSDAFMEYLVAEDQSLDPFFTTIAVEPLVDGSPFPMGPAASQTVHYGIPNTILLVETRPSTLADIGTTNEKMLDDLRDHVHEYRRILPPESKRRGRIYVRLADPFDTYDDDPEYLLRIVKMLGEEEITGILFEDVKGTRFPFETYALVRMMRHYHPKPRKILAHPHTANGTEDAAALECILAGGDGVWSGFTPQAAQGGHGSALMLLTNLMRARNPRVRELFNTQIFQSVAMRMWRIHDNIDIPPNTPVVGERAYLYVDKYFEQTDEPRDLAPELIGRKPGYQIMPSWAPTYVIERRLIELGYGTDITSNQALLGKMRALMNAALNEGRHIRFDEPQELVRLLDDAIIALEESPPAEVDDLGAASALTQRYR
jgi:isopropylmalate/homocitrate/citramalate synthase